MMTTQVKDNKSIVETKEEGHEVVTFAPAEDHKKPAEESKYHGFLKALSESPDIFPGMMYMLIEAAKSKRQLTEGSHEVAHPYPKHSKISYPDAVVVTPTKAQSSVARVKPEFPDEIIKNWVKIKDTYLELLQEEVVMEVVVYVMQDPKSGPAPDKFMMTFDLLNKPSFATTFPIKLAPFFLWKGRWMGEMSNMYGPGTEHFGEVIKNAQYVAKRDQPNGPNEQMCHPNATSPQYRNPHFLFASFITIEEKFTIQQQVEKVINHMKELVVADDFQDAYLKLIPELYASPKQVKLSESHKDVEKSKYRGNLWVNLLAGLCKPTIKYQTCLKHGLVDEDILRILPKFFPEETNLPAPALWDPAICQIVYGSNAAP